MGVTNYLPSVLPRNIYQVTIGNARLVLSETIAQITTNCGWTTNSLWIGQTFT